MSFSIVYKIKNDQDVTTLIKINNFCEYLGYSMEELQRSTLDVRMEDGTRDNYFYICRKMYVKFLNELGYSSRVITEKFGINQSQTQFCCYNTYKRLFYSKKYLLETNGHRFVEKIIESHSK